MQDKFPDLLVKDIQELLEVGSDLKLEAVNGIQIPYNGWVGTSSSWTTQQQKLQYRS